jgi:hypothetical protein
LGGAPFHPVGKKNSEKIFMAERKHLIRPLYSSRSSREALATTDTLRQAISNIERGGARVSDHDEALLDGIAEGMTNILRARLAPLETRLSKLERAMGVEREE